MTLKKDVFVKIVEKGEYAGSFFPPTKFSTLPKREIIILVIFDMLSAKVVNLVQSKILLFSKELTPYYQRTKMFIRPKDHFCFQNDRGHWRKMRTVIKPA